jgi:hypothetical protein
MTTAQQVTARRDTTTTTMATGDYDNDVNGDGASGNDFDDDGDDDDDNDGNGAMVDGIRRRWQGRWRRTTTTMTSMATARLATKSTMMATARRATGYDNNDDGDGRRRQRGRW